VSNDLQERIKELEERQDKILDNQKEMIRLIRGGTQPDKQIKIKGEDGGPGDAVVAKIISKARQGNSRSGCTSSKAHKIVEDAGYERSRQAILNMLETMSHEFDHLKYKKRKSSGQENVLYHDA